MKDIYSNSKGDMTNKPGAKNNGMFVIKVLAYKNINDVLNEIKAKGAMIVKLKGEWEKPYSSIQYIKVEKII